jgi:dienelactone hydrolase
VQVTSRVDRGGHEFIDLTYASPVLGRVPAHLYRPLNAAGDTPALVLMHGLPGTRHQMAPLAAAYADAGVFVLAITAPYSRVDLPYREPALIPAPRFDEYDRIEAEQVIQDLRRGIDLLEQTEGVDPSRIGYAGFSAGGGYGALMAAVEPRLAAVALMAPTSGLVTWLDHTHESHPVNQTFRELSAETRGSWRSSMWPVEPVRWLARASALPLLVQAAELDTSVTRGDTETLLAAAPEGTLVRWYDAPHGLSPAAFQDQARFFARHVGVDATRFMSPPRGF